MARLLNNARAPGIVTIQVHDAAADLLALHEALLAAVIARVGEVEAAEWALDQAKADHRVPVADKPQQLCQLRSRGVPAGGLVGKNPVQHLALKLAQLILVDRAYPHVADALTIHGGLQSSTCENESQRPYGRRQDTHAGLVPNPQNDAGLPQAPHVSAREQPRHGVRCSLVRKERQ